jgi:hypothetical protein
MQTTESIKKVTQATADACTSAARTTARVGRESVERGLDYTRRNPIKVLFGALTVGVLVGLALQRREATWQERAFSGPTMKKVKGWAQTAGETLQDYRERATEVAGDALETARKTARGLRFWS